jgi:leucine dehydrogenase
MDVIGERCSSVFGKTEVHGGSGTSAPATADGVFIGIRASAKHAFGTDDLSRRTVLVQGVGAVGSILARLVADAGGRVVVTDVDEVRAKELAVEVDGDVVAPENAIGSECDVFSPNATGGVLSSDSIPRLRCRIVAGAANNQLAEPTDAEQFAEREILYAPDYVVNAGGIIHLASLEMLGETVEERDRRIAAIGVTVTEVFRIADAEHISTERAADRIVQQRLAESAR